MIGAVDTFEINGDASMPLGVTAVAWVDTVVLRPFLQIQQDELGQLQCVENVSRETVVPGRIEETIVVGRRTCS
jgi:hypothetical protein